LLAAVAVVGALRRLPLAYGAYALVGLLIPLCAPAPEQPLRAIGRYAMVLFPLFMWGATFVERRGWTDTLVPISAGLLAIFCAGFATWQPVL
jgi:hypothetical protein